MKAGKTQQEELRAAREALDVNTEALADKLGASLRAVRSWVLPITSAGHRTMPETARRLLKMIVAEHRAKNRAK